MNSSRLIYIIIYMVTYVVKGKEAMSLKRVGEGTQKGLGRGNIINNVFTYEIKRI